MKHSESWRIIILMDERKDRPNPDRERVEPAKELPQYIGGKLVSTPCSRCEGTGRMFRDPILGFDLAAPHQKCPACHGEGAVAPHRSCSRCEGDLNHDGQRWRCYRCEDFPSSTPNPDREERDEAETERDAWIESAANCGDKLKAAEARAESLQARVDELERRIFDGGRELGRNLRESQARVRELEEGVRRIANLDGGYPDDYCALARSLLSHQPEDTDG
jgi:hypothetical protein